MSNVCPCCKRAYRANRIPGGSKPSYQTIELELTELAARDTGPMTNRQVHAHYAAIGPFMDMRAFMNRSDLSPELMARADRLYRAILSNKGKHTAATKLEYRRLHEAWRGQSFETEYTRPGKTRARILAALAASRAARQACKMPIGLADIPWIRTTLVSFTAA